MNNSTNIHYSAIVHLRIYSYFGISLGATHFHGDLSGYLPGYKLISLKVTLSPAQALKLNVQDVRRGLGETYSPGASYEGFDSETDIKQLATKVWKKHFPTARFLLIGSDSVLEPKSVLATTLPPEDDTKLKFDTQTIVDRYEAIGWNGRGYSNDREGMDRCTDEWEQLFREVKLAGAWANE